MSDDKKTVYGSVWSREFIRAYRENSFFTNFSSQSDWDEAHAMNEAFDLEKLLDKPADNENEEMRL